MKDIASHILDITENSVRAGATLIEIRVETDRFNNQFRFSIKDNGCGMSSEMVSSLKNPFFTTRTSRRVGMGIPLLMQNCEMSGGDVEISSEQGKGTELIANFGLSHIDRPPEGDIGDVFVNIATGYSQCDFIFEYKTVKGEFLLDTRQVKEIFDGLSINDLDVVEGLKEIVQNQIKELKQ